MTNLNSIVEGLAKQALGSKTSATSGGLGGILGAVVSQLGGSQSSNPSGGLGGIVGSVLGQLGQQQSTSTGSSENSKSSLLIMVVPLILGWVQQQGGLSGVISALNNAGLGSQLQQWLDPNQKNDQAPVEQMQNLFSAQEVEQVAHQAQVPTEQIYSAISSVLPQIVDALTPQGTQTNPAEANNDVTKVMAMLGTWLK